MENSFMRVEEVARELGVSRSFAYRVIRQMNQELQSRGFLTIAGRVHRDYFRERFYMAKGEMKEDASIQE